MDSEVPRCGLGAAAAVTIALLATGCAAEEDKGSGGESGNKDVAIGGEAFGTADEETAKLGSDAEAGVFPRTVKHANGTTEIEKKPERVVVLDTGELDDVLSLGIKPVGMVTTEGANPVPSYLDDQVEGVETLGTIQELDLEKIASLEPALILGSQLRYDELDSIAPTVFSIRPGFPWKENFRLVGEAMGMEHETAANLKEYAEEAEGLRADVDGDRTISLVRFMPERPRLYANQSLIGVILNDAGFKRPKNQDVNELAVEISPENLDQAEGNYVFYASYGDPGATGEEAALDSSQWRGLDAVKDGKAVRVNDDVWFRGLGPTGAGQILDDLGDHLGE
ncbi:ABC transporter substrate-binding protein [Brevibacterium limosum]|uniref:ABC transporter substrate-binding protein n=1 Tax=Brevibacterium limosum TaxID=2697565 RepID=UPI001420BAE6|nr:iron-siderophore ABC transporter substrate-binding protein [Brevibacterium limosum]